MDLLCQEIRDNFQDNNYFENNRYKLWQFVILMGWDKLPIDRSISIEGRNITNLSNIVSNLTENWILDINVNWNSQKTIYNCYQEIVGNDRQTVKFVKIDEIAEDLPDPLKNYIIALYTTTDKETEFTPSQKRKMKQMDDIHQIWDLTDLRSALLPIVLNDNGSIGFGKPVNLRFHQKLLVDRTLELFQDQTTQCDRILWACVPRSGKSIMMAGLVEQYKPERILIILGAKSETESQFKEIFESYTSLSDYQLFDPNNEYRINGKLVWIVSAQKLKYNREKEEFKKLVKKLFPEGVKCLLFMDEAHRGLSTQLASTTLRNIGLLKPDLKCFDQHKLVFLTATYGKPIIRYILKDNKSILRWDYSDMLESRRLCELSFSDYFPQKYPMLSNQIRQLFDWYRSRGVDCETLSRPYQEFPRLNCYIPHLLIKDAPDTSNITEILRIKDDRGTTYNEIFQNPSEVKKVIFWVTRKLTNFEQIGEHIGQHDFHSMIWFLPTPHSNAPSRGQTSHGQTSHPVIEPLTRGLVDLLLSDKEFRNEYCIVVIHRQNPDDSFELHEVTYSNRSIEDQLDEDDFSEDYIDCLPCFSTKCIVSDNVGQCIKEQEYQARLKDKNLLILTGQMLRLGINLPCVDLAFMFDPIESFDNLYQSMFRVLTESPGKKNAFFVDLISDRFTQFIFNYCINTREMDPTGYDTVRHMGEILDLFNINGYSLKRDSVDKLEIYNQIIKHILKNLAKYTAQLDKDLKYSIRIGLDDLDLDFSDLQLLNNYQPGKHSSNHKISDRKTPKPKPSQKTRVDDQPLDDQPADDQPLDDQPLDDQPADDQPLDDQPLDDQLDSVGNLGRVQQITQDQEGGKPKITEKVSPFSGSSEMDHIQLNQKISYNEIVNLIGGAKLDKAQADNLLDILETITDMLAIFYGNGEAIDCNSIGNCIELIKWKREMNELSVEELCSEDKYLIMCYYKRLLKWDNTKLDQLGQLYQKIYFQNEDIASLLDQRFEMTRSKLEIYYSDSILAEGVFKTQILESGKVKLLEYLNERLKLRDAEKQLYGDVFTPLTLVDEMLSKFDEYAPEVWTNPNYKWLDPANGRGNFPVIAYYKLMQGLASWEPDAEKRSRHIIRNMLYMVELNAVNVHISRKIFGPDANIFCGDFLKDHWQQHFGVEKFDVIMGNPPFNEGGTKSTGKMRFWIQFVNRSLEILKSNGYLIMIHPSQWRNPSPMYKEINKTILDNQILFLKMLNLKESQKYFNTTVQVDYYLLQKTKPVKKTQIIDIDNNESEYMLHIGQISNNNTSIIDKSVAFTKIYDDLSEFRRSNEMSITKLKSVENKTSDELERKSISRIYPILKFIRKNGQLLLVYSSVPHSLQNAPKIMLNDGFYLKPIYDDGHFGIGDHIYYTITNPSNRLLLYLQSKFVNYIDISSRTGNRISKQLFTLIPDIRNVPESELPEITDQALYKFFGLTPEEIALVEKVASGAGSSHATASSDPECTDFLKQHKTQLEGCEERGGSDHNWNYWVDRCYCQPFNKSVSGDTSINPLSGRKIKNTAPAFIKIQKCCKKFDQYDKSPGPKPTQLQLPSKQKQTEATKVAVPLKTKEKSKSTNCSDFFKSHPNLLDDGPSDSDLDEIEECFCKPFRQNRLKNPISNRTIKADKKLHKQLSDWFNKHCNSKQTVVEDDLVEDDLVEDDLVEDDLVEDDVDNREIVIQEIIGDDEVVEDDLVLEDSDLDSLVLDD